MPVLVDLDAASLDTLPCCGLKNAAHEGRCDKSRWLKAQFKNGLRAKVLLTPDNRQCGYIEYIPGEYAWRGVDAGGYMFIHCIFIFRKQYQRLGLGGLMIQACLDDAAQAGMRGVAVVVREGPWLAGAPVFLANGFEAVAAAAPDYRLLVRKLNPAAPNPAFKAGLEDRLKKYRQGLTIIRSDQCPYIAKFAGEIAQTTNTSPEPLALQAYIAKFAGEIAQTAEREYGIKPRIVQIRSHREAQNAPTPYAVFAVLYKGRILADHQISRTRFRNIMRTLPA